MNLIKEAVSKVLSSLFFVDFINLSEHNFKYLILRNFIEFANSVGRRLEKPNFHNRR